ncbi:murein hydrolase activator NlpD [Candidatus Erwinia haradaeae]|uniref:Murein hydrolase activator NlpD n=1 Tax=Candidatus Erwinia haradaeae TaxID=1922217 RepID=A0A803GC83_9GAMM|nr:murein hydrolase activator NlpD [Candidatus Erwinia haradaeae]VFP87475.1 Murein hydrolase activator NlpD [Candidatus Erwinia haradaeae]
MKIGKLLFKLNPILVIVVLGFGLIGCSSAINTTLAINLVKKNTSYILRNYFDKVKKITNIDIAHPTRRKSLSKLNIGIHLHPSKLLKIKKLTQKYNETIKKKKNKNLNKTRYNQANYTVKQGDTLFHIASVTNNTVYYLAKNNHIPMPYLLTVGQKLNFLSRKNSTKKSKNTEISVQQKNKHKKPVSDTKTKIKKDNIRHKSNIFYPKTLNPIHNINSFPTSNNRILKKPELITTHVTRNFTKKTIPIIIHWRWPIYGKIIDNFSSEEGGNKGIDIAGAYGHAIVSTASGRVVYAGNELRGYGNLIIIKHNDDYLSAYAHNATIFVAEQQTVKGGQKIATMGNSGTNSVRLHFELRYKGKSVNPLYYLPKR